MQCLLPTEDETRIVVNFSDGQESISVDAVDIDNIVLEVRKNDIPEDSSFEAQFARMFYAKYNRRIGPTAANFLCQVKYKIFEKVKKNLFVPDAPSDTTEQEPTSQTETSDSSRQ